VGIPELRHWRIPITPRCSHALSDFGVEHGFPCSQSLARNGAPSFLWGACFRERSPAMNVRWTPTEWLVSGAPELSRRLRMNLSTHSRFELHAKVFWLAATCDILHSPASPVTVVSVQGAYGSCVGYSEVREALWHLR